MPVQLFNDAFLGNAAVPTSGSRDMGSAPSAPPTATGRPAGLAERSGLDSPRTTVTTRMASPKGTSAARSDKRPPAVDTFPDGR